MKILKYWLPVIAWAGLIFFLSSIPHLKSNLEYDFLLRKLAHITEYFILTGLLYRAFKGTSSLDAVGLFICPSILAILYAASDEFHQRFVPGRVGATHDVLIDSIGVFGFFIFLKIAAKRRSKGGAG